MKGLEVAYSRNGDVIHSGALRLPLTQIQPQSCVDPPLSCNWYSVGPGKRVTLHMHTTKSELWFIVSGKGQVTLATETIDVESGTSIMTPPNMPHALRNTGSDALVFVGVAHPPSRPILGTNRIAGTIELEQHGAAL